MNAKQMIVSMIVAIPLVSPQTRAEQTDPNSVTGFTGHWTAIDLDGSSLTMHIGRGDAPRVRLRDSYSSCADSGSPSTPWVGFGTGEYFEIWLFVNFEKTHCGASGKGNPLTLQFYWDPGSDTLWEDEDGDGVGVTWYRVMSAAP